MISFTSLYFIYLNSGTLIFLSLLVIVRSMDNDYLYTITSAEDHYMMFSMKGMTSEGSYHGMHVFKLPLELAELWSKRSVSSLLLYLFISIYRVIYYKIHRNIMYKWFPFYFRYLHEDCQSPIIHQNFESSSVLLDDELAVRICDSGLASVLSSKNVTQVFTVHYVQTIYLSMSLRINNTENISVFFSMLNS